MKVCRMCWALLDDQLNICNCTQGADPSIFFKDTSEMVNHFVTHERLMSKRARILEKLVKEEIKKCDENYDRHEAPCDWQNISITTQVSSILESLVEKSNNTVKEKGSGQK